MLVKLFAASAGYFTSIVRAASRLEQEVNDWLQANPEIRVLDIKQSSNGGSAEPSKIVLSIWYEPEPHSRPQPFAAAAEAEQGIKPK